MRLIKLDGGGKSQGERREKLTKIKVKIFENLIK